MGFIEGALALFRGRSRRAWSSHNRAHVEYREAGAEELARLEGRILELAKEVPGLEWAELNHLTRRVVFAFEDDSVLESQLEELVAKAEVLTHIDGASFHEELSEHPADLEPAIRLMVEIIADAAGLAFATMLSVSPVPSFTLGGGVAGILSLVKASPKLRQGIDERFGIERADLLLNLASAAAQGIAQRQGTQLVEIVSKLGGLREVQARRRAWDRRESELTRKPTRPSENTRHLEPRPRDLPRGPIEEYADRALFVSLGGFALSFVATRSFQRAIAALFGGLPKPARMGREMFASSLGRVLSGRGLLVMDADAVRRFDRVDCLVLQGDLVSQEKFVFGRVRTDENIQEEEARRHALELFDPDAPLEIQRRGKWRLGPAARLDAEATTELDTTSSEWAQGGALVLHLAAEREVVATVEVRVVPQTGVEELIATAHDAGMRVVIAGAEESLLEGLHADDVITEQEGLTAGIRRLQREGRGVMLVASGDSPGLPISDVAVGLFRPGEAPPWGAHIICREDLSDVRFILEACPTARRVAKQSVNIALGAATMGALVSAGGLLPMTTRRVLFVVNTASLISMANGLRTSFELERRALPPPRDPTPWHALDAQGVLARLRSSSQGLSLRDAQRRSRPDVEPRSAAVQLAEAITDELFNPLAPLLAAGAGLSAMVGSVADAGMVGGVVVLNALVGGVQRFRTERAIRDLARSTRRHALVRRDGQLRYVDANELVRGDLVELHAGDVVPADCRIVEASSVQVDSSSLTGESLPVAKSATPSYEAQIADRRSMLYADTSLASGKATAVVVAIGDETEARRGAAARSDRTHGGVEQRLRSLMNLTGPVALAAGVGVVGAGVLRGRRLSDLVDAGVSLAVGAVPEGLPLLATAAQLSAAERLSKRGALVRNVRSVEALGRVDVLCVDKTGTVTEGRIRLSLVSDGADQESIEELGGARLRVLAAALRATPDRQAKNDPLDEALHAVGARLGVRRDYSAEGWKQLSELSFEAGRGYHAVLGQLAEGPALSVKGAPEVLLPQCSRWQRGQQSVTLDETTRKQLSDAAERLARTGLRVIAVAERRVSSEDRLDPERLMGLSFLGLLAFSDPVRGSAAEAIKNLRRAGVRTLMITGDHPSTAEAIGAELDLLQTEGTLSGADLGQMSDDDLDARIQQVSIFARVTPSQKVRIVRALQRAGKVVAMVGDGANDAPAIRLADVGIAIGEHSTTAARRAADVVVTDERVETLVEALLEGRATWASVRDAVSILVGGNLGEIGFTLGAGLVDGRPPLNARQLLLVNLFTDVAPAMAIALRPPTEETLAHLANEGPEVSLGSPLNRDIAGRAAVTALGAGGAWAVGRLTGSATRARTIGLAALVGTQLGQTMSSGNYSPPVVITSLGSAALLAGIIQMPFVSQFFGCRPLGPLGWATAIGASVAATSASIAVPRTMRDIGERIREQAAGLADEARPALSRLPSAAD